MTIRYLFRSAGFRFALIHAVLLAISAIALAAFLWWSTAGLLDRQMESEIQTDAQSLSDRWHEAGIRGLIATIRFAYVSPTPLIRPEPR